MISLFSEIRLIVSPLTLNNLPRIGYIPIRFLSSRLKPDTIPDLAESPSHKINVHSDDLAVPAQFASTNFGIPRIDFVFAPSVFFADFLSFTAVNSHAASITPILAIFSQNSSLTLQDEPNLDVGVDMKSFVWLSNDGLVISQRKNNINCSLIVVGLTSTFLRLRIYA